MHSEITDIAVIGGGMVGAALLALLAKANPSWSLTLIERFAIAEPDQRPYQPSFDDRSTAIAHGSVSLLREAGVWNSMAPAATAIETVHVSDRGHFGGALIEKQQFGVDALGYVIPNVAIGRALLGRLADLPNLTVLAPRQVSTLQPQADGVSLNLDDETSLKARLVVIADGANSSLCHRMGIGTRVEEYHQSVIVANVECEQSHQGVAFERFTDRGPLAMLPLDGPEGRRCALVWTQPESETGSVMALGDELFLQNLQQRFGYRLGRLLRVGKRESYDLQLCEAEEQVRSRLVVMGNAAHFLHPVAGQGFNLALRDCAALADTLRSEGGAEDPGNLAVLQSYIDRQQADQRITIAFSDQLTRLFSTSRLPQAALRSLGFLGLECFTPARRLLGLQTMGEAGRRVAWSE